ncbi:MAG: hypothetical protein COA47_00670 [Robiginitomaculum sp.]|nr:MAG: hypothetical protein COA47_00670 [Robiginitomaculum sp.]
MVRAFGFWLSISLGVNLVAGFVAFAIATERMNAASSPSPAKGIVVLTGGSGERIRHAAWLLQKQSGQRLLVSGVNPKVSQQDLLNLSGLSKANLQCCVDVDVQAQNTIGNARQIALWANAHRYDSLLVVTSGYHMPRALLELQAVLPGVQLQAVAVRSNGPARQRMVRRTLVEYAKYLVVLLFGSSGSAPAGTQQ